MLYHRINSFCRPVGLQYSVLRLLREERLKTLSCAFSKLKRCRFSADDRCREVAPLKMKLDFRNVCICHYHLE